ncbi:hypothetical protein PCL_01721 [Purpureocillium lilacinum]|uniref:Uncharacterized protein n=1 Tax=Purpureocillium lilacinum TaxID=33203 RepID=A0A2U3E298_PURLI|nr:hypothetical protein PCL_01721 [Purpureocillium lilacinum]
MAPVEWFECLQFTDLSRNIPYGTLAMPSPPPGSSTNGLWRPDTPYVAAASANELYFIDTCLDNETASRIKQNIESAALPRPEEYVFIDEIMAAAERRNRATGETTFCIRSYLCQGAVWKSNEEARARPC